MAGRRIIPMRAAKLAVVPAVADVEIDRAIGAVADAVQELQARRERVHVVATLVTGTNRVRHGLGRPFAGYTITPTVANAAFAHALSSTKNPRPDLEVWIDVVNGPQANAAIEVY